MVEVILAKAFRYSKDRPLGNPGQVVEVSEDTFERHKDSGLFTFGDETANDGPVVEHVEDAPIADDDHEETPKPVKGKLSRPKQVASVAVWREYAESLGLKVTGMTKPEIIGAVDAAE